MNWSETGHAHVFSSVITPAQRALDRLSNDDWLAVKGDRAMLVTKVAERYGIGAEAADVRVADMENSINYSRFAF